MNNNSVNVELNLRISYSTAIKCLKLVEMFLLDNPDYKVEYDRGSENILKLRCREMECKADGFGGVIKTYKD